MAHVDTDDLTLAALGVIDLPPVEAGHLRSCSACSDTLAGLRGTVLAARGDGPAAAPPVPPPARVWTAITDELGLPRPRVRPRAAPWARRLALAAAALVIAGASAGVGATVAGRDAGVATARPTVSDPAGPTTTPPTVLARADLRPLEQDIFGSARWVRGPAGPVLEVEVSGARVPTGYLEVWLLDPGSPRMVSLGALHAGVLTTLTVPDGIAVSDYPTVDVSAEPLDEDPTHSGVSVARGELRPTR